MRHLDVGLNCFHKPLTKFRSLLSVSSTSLGTWRSTWFNLRAMFWSKKNQNNQQNVYLTLIFTQSFCWHYSKTMNRIQIHRVKNSLFRSHRSPAPFPHTLLHCPSISKFPPNPSPSLLFSKPWLVYLLIFVTLCLSYISASTFLFLSPFLNHMIPKGIGHFQKHFSETGGWRVTDGHSQNFLL